MIPLTNHDFQWGRSEVVIIYPDWVNVAGNFNQHNLSHVMPGGHQTSSSLCLGETHPETGHVFPSCSTGKLLIYQRVNINVHSLLTCHPTALVNNLNDIKHLQSIVEPPKFKTSKTFVQRPTAFLRFVQVTAFHMAFHHAERWTRHG